MSGGLPLLVTRPEPGNSATMARANALGFDAHAMPLFAARALPWTAPPPTGYDALLLTSVQAVRLAGPQLGRLAMLPVYAVGAATADAAQAAGLSVARTGEANAQSLLDAMTSENIAGILWLCGRDRTDFDPRGAALEPLACYAVDPVAPSPDWQKLIAGPAVLLAHSARAAARLAELVGPVRAHLTLVAISPAVAAAAGDGWADLVASEQPTDAAMLALAHALCHKGRK
ncbi:MULTISPECIES: uroporphyrinogen-III synthase [unclassified Sphingopyxis]|uniref:uroporphyrinogen-III synthase n=1 Tax=unclassified Sphingopyxis TaxID=2614943 RepID=UPI002865AF1E|nr:MULTISPECIES: uroporphyrinogen-III synthase [unclassified Sphingopyxis]MDR6833401.1 uroporphyrinogen-III synthase [Sphingopyxis sp. BE122]MDR7225670.1 uroporphyrinogen-III synthase [Sphingopyxis sp. BE259]